MAGEPGESPPAGRRIKMLPNIIIEEQGTFVNRVNCGKHSLIGRDSRNPHQVHIIQLFCDSWNCPRCRKRKLSRLERNLSDIPNLVRFVAKAPRESTDEVYTTFIHSLRYLCLHSSDERLAYFSMLLRPNGDFFALFTFYFKNDISKEVLDKLWLKAGGLPNTKYQRVESQLENTTWLNAFMGFVDEHLSRCARIRSSRNFFGLRPSIKCVGDNHEIEWCYSGASQKAEAVAHGIWGYTIEIRGNEYVGWPPV